MSLVSAVVQGLQQALRVHKSGADDVGAAAAAVAVPALAVVAADVARHWTGGSAVEHGLRSRRDRLHGIGQERLLRSMGGKGGGLKIDLLIVVALFHLERPVSRAMAPEAARLSMLCGPMNHLRHGGSNQVSTHVLSLSICAIASALNAYAQAASKGADRAAGWTIAGSMVPTRCESLHACAASLGSVATALECDVAHSQDLVS